MRRAPVGRLLSRQAKALGAKPWADEESVHDDAVKRRSNFGDQRELFGTEQQGAGTGQLKAEDIRCDATPPGVRP